MKVLKFRKLSRGIKLFFSFFIIFSLLMVVANETEYRASLEQVSKVVVADLKAYSLSIDEKISSVAGDVFLLKELIQRKDVLILDNGTIFESELAKEELEEELELWLDNRNVYDQVRIIGVNGQEILRVNYSYIGSTAVEDKLLQDKSDRYYFTNSIGLTGNSLYLSEFDLNVENGEVQYVNGETKQVLRFSTPLFDKDNNTLGIIIFNYLSKDLFHYSDNFEEFDHVNFEVVDSNGYYLHAYDLEIEYGFMFEDKLNEVFSKYHDFDIFGISHEGITQSEETNEIYSAFVLSELSLSDTVSNVLGERINVISDGGDLFVFGEIILEDTVAYKTILFKYVIYTMIAITFSYAFSRFIDELEHLRQKQIRLLKHSSEHDHLTGVPNRLNIYEQLENVIEEERDVTILFLDFDGFKGVNDKLGHDAGDKVLIEGVRRLIECVRGNDVVSRIGGDEFIIALFDLTDINVITRICNRILEKFSSPFIVGKDTFNMGISIGVARNNKNEDLETLISRADKAMYFVKNGTKNGFIFDTDIIEI